MYDPLKAISYFVFSPSISKIDIRQIEEKIVENNDK